MFDAELTAALGSLLYLGSVALTVSIQRTRRYYSTSYPTALMSSEHLKEYLAKCDLNMTGSGIWDLIDPYGIYQTTVGVINRKLYFSKAMKYDRELLILEDGGQVAIDWRVSKNREDDGVPLVLLQHGLCGHSQSGYVKSMIRELENAGYYVVVFVARGCGRVPLTTPETFTASRTSDFHAVIEQIRQKHPKRELHTIGFSLGAGLLLKYLGEQGAKAKSVIKSAVAICPSFDFFIKTETFKYFSAGTVKSLQALVKTHKDFLKDHPTSKLDWDGMFKARNILEFDQAAIVGTLKGGQHDYLHHPTVDDYYSASSCIKYSFNVQIPTLAIVASDDPVCAAEGSPTQPEQVGPGLLVLKTRHGGHLGFLSGWLGTGGTFWCDQLAREWIQAVSR